MNDVNNVSPKIESSWKEVLTNEFNSEYFFHLKTILTNELQNCIIFPKGNEIFNAYNLTPLYKVKVVIIGQDPYHGQDQAHGLSFSVKKGVAIPPSLKNIFKELKRDVNFSSPTHGNLESWSKQGVMLLNASLTVRKGEPNSHQQIGWHNFTDATIKAISDNKKNVIFLLWGNFAQEKEKLIDQTNHYILKTTHPSPFSARNGFLGCGHFSKTNAILKKIGKTSINWDIE